MPDYRPTDLRVWRVEAGLTVKRAATIARVSKTVVLQTGVTMLGLMLAATSLGGR